MPNESSEDGAGMAMAAPVDPLLVIKRLEYEVRQIRQEVNTSQERANRWQIRAERAESVIAALRAVLAVGMWREAI